MLLWKTSCSPLGELKCCLSLVFLIIHFFHYIIMIMYHHWWCIIFDFLINGIIIKFWFSRFLIVKISYRRGSMSNLPMAMRFRQLKTTSKLSVGVYRSEIHGRGLFALRNFESGEMVIEYAGEVSLNFFPQAYFSLIFFWWIVNTYRLFKMMYQIIR